MTQRLQTHLQQTENLFLILNLDVTPILSNLDICKRQVKYDILPI